MEHGQNSTKFYKPWRGGNYASLLSVIDLILLSVQEGRNTDALITEIT